MTTPFQDMFTAVQTMMTAASAASPTTVVAAPTNYGSDFRITPGTAVYQVQISPARDWPRANIAYPRAVVSVLIHHYVNSLTNEKAFLHQTMSEVTDRLLVMSVWSSQAGVYSLQPDIEPEISDGSRVGNVISFEVSAAVLATPP